MKLGEPRNTYVSSTSLAQGAHVPCSDYLSSVFTRKGKFEGIAVYECRWMPKGAGMALPGIGIVVYPGAYSTRKNLVLLRHEFGHFLQARQIGKLQFYVRVGIPSLWSAMRHGKRGHKHHLFWTEVWANKLAAGYFRDSY